MQLGRNYLQLTGCGCILATILSLPFVSGCGGCRGEDTVEKEEQLDKEKKPKLDFELTRVMVLPSTLDNEEESTPEEADDADGESIFDSMVTLARTAVKPGHWVEVRHRIQANNFDFVGELSTNVLDRDMNRVTIPRSPYHMVSIRPTSLPKAQQKYIDVPMLIPDVDSNDSKLVQLGARLESRSGSRVVDFGGRPTVRLGAHQFFFVVLSDEPERYGYLKTLTVIRPPQFNDDEWDALPGDYAIKFINGDQPLPLPSSSLTWTSTAYLIWDDFDPGLLSTDQQSALLDWLHWGGQLIISGPRSLDRLRGSFLDDYLPAVAGRVVAIEASRFAAFNERWTIYPRRPKRPKADYSLQLGDRPMEVIQLELRDNGTFLAGTSELVAERRVGRGSVVVSAFSLTDRRMVNWPGYDSFANACLMRRAPRKFSIRQGNSIAEWSRGGLTRDAMRLSGLRYFVRDAEAMGGEFVLNRSNDVPLTQALDGVPNASPVMGRRPSAARLNKDPGYVSSPVAGVAGWTDFSAAANSVRYALQSSSGINVPDRVFVARVLGAYLLCLVPLNWLLFRLIGRVEWAWIAAPVIAIVGGIGIVKMAELDIGFVRARTELSVLELQEGYPRAHVARYTGLYTSLTSDYAVQFDDVTALAAPFSTNPTSDQLRMQQPTDVQYRQDATVGLSGFPVISNSTGMVHVEQMVDVGGTLELSGNDETFRIVNDTELKFDSSFVLYRDTEVSCQVALVGRLDARAEANIDLKSEIQLEQLIEFLNNQPGTSVTRTEPGALNPREVVEVASNWNQLQVGEYRFIGWNTTEVPGMTVRPGSNQETFCTLVLANLRYASRPQPGPDLNVYEEFRAEEELLESDPPTGAT